MFFGRTRARSELREVLARQASKGSAFVLVLGASGSGKSSLVKAGLIPDLMLPGMIGRVALCRRAVLRPGDQPDDLMRGLAAAIMAPTALPELAQLRYTPERLADLLREAPKQAILPIEQGLAEAAKAAALTEIAEARLVLLVDQLEELFTIQTIGEEQRNAFVAALAALAQSGLVWVVATMRSDFFDRIDTVPALVELASSESRYLLQQPDSAEIGQIIRRPAREAGLRFEFDAQRGISLNDEILRAAGNRSALPLLSFLLDQLWRQRTPNNELTFAAYRSLGGLEGALGRRATQVFENQSPEVQAALPRVLRALVTVAPSTASEATARTMPISRFAENSAERKLVEIFLAPEARLFVADAEEGGNEPRIRVTHEALLTHWDRARDQITEDRADLELKSRTGTCGRALARDRRQSARQPAAGQRPALVGGRGLHRTAPRGVRGRRHRLRPGLARGRAGTDPPGTRARRGGPAPAGRSGAARRPYQPHLLCRCRDVAGGRHCRRRCRLDPAQPGRNQLRRDIRSRPPETSRSSTKPCPPARFRPRSRSASSTTA